MKEPINSEELNKELRIVFHYLLKKGISHTDAQDAVQETAYKYLKYYHSIRSAKVRSWLMRVSLNYYYDQCRKNKKYIFNVEERLNKEEGGELPESILLDKEGSEEFYHLLSRLKPLFSELLILKYVFEFSYKEISELLGINVSSVKTNLFRARKKLMSIYEKGGLE
ncbi:RNA polymerase sigma factor [Radiobacillus deserti]|uniref:RNA polymerase sigma factor n=1 Tax=Radiobacillus deserti TaxID=2594883 RepID=A0A516KID7_9BACI|nr:RNA polymerase sigma factor [Radiobacillus deserti]QDP41160.1 RNA polymerase sigma factor [Radiobacillus deserti]